jgi:hypothetical protein
MSDDGGHEHWLIVFSLSLEPPTSWLAESYALSSLALQLHILPQRNRRSAHRQDAGQSQGA